MSEIDFQAAGQAHHDQRVDAASTEARERPAGEEEKGVGHLCRFRYKDGPANKFGDLGDYGVSEGAKSVHPIGNPIIHSTNCGSGRVPRTGRPSISVVRQPAPKFEPNVGFVYPRLLRGVGNNPDAISAVGGTNGARRNAIPLDMKPERGQVCENFTGSQPEKLEAIFQDNDAGSNFANDAGHRAPEARAFASKAGLFTRWRYVLTGKPAADRINGNSIGSKAVCGEFADVMITRNLRPMFRKNATRKFLDFAECYGLEAARALQPEREAANAAEQVKKLVHVSAFPVKICAAAQDRAATGAGRGWRGYECAGQASPEQALGQPSVTLPAARLAVRVDRDGRAHAARPVGGEA